MRPVAISREDVPISVSAVMPLRPSSVGGAGSFLVVADDGRRYWCKSLNNFQSPRVPITEQLVGRLGALIGAPVCEVALVLLDDVVGWEIRPGSGRVVEPGWATGRSRSIL
jgi:hypothetical protein